MQRGGLVEHWRRKFWPNADRCSTTATGGTDGDVIQPISVTDIQGAFYVLFIGKIQCKISQAIYIKIANAGTGIAFIIFMIERHHHRKLAKIESELIRPYLN